MAKRSMQQWLDAYGVSHQNPTNKLIHWICVPTIYFCVVGLLYSIPSPVIAGWTTPGLVAKVAMALVALFYLRLSFPIMIGMMLFSVACLLLAGWIDVNVTVLPLWAISLGLFVLAWIGQFYGHKVEGMKPSFLDDLQFLMIGPAWLMSFIYRRLGIAY
jgi:uncharacterized membrane protein YGL010W